jgi:hypothetical protein
MILLDEAREFSNQRKQLILGGLRCNIAFVRGVSGCADHREEHDHRNEHK